MLLPVPAPLRHPRVPAPPGPQAVGMTRKSHSAQEQSPCWVAEAERANAPFQMVSATPVLPHPCGPCCQAANLRQETQGKSHQRKELQQEGEGKGAGNGAL